MASDQVAGNQLHLSVLSEDNIRAIDKAALEILERTGVFVESPPAREMLRGAGALVNGDKVRIPSFLVEQALRSAPKRVVIANRNGERYLFLEGNRSYYTGALDCPQLIDPFSRVRRTFTSKDYALTARVIDACPHVSGGSAPGNAMDYPPEVRAQVAFKYTIMNTKKPFLSCPLDAQQMADVYDMAAAIAGGYDRLRQAPFVIATCEPTTPLRLFKDATEILLLSARENLPVVLYPMPAAGATTPCSPAATLTIGFAEILAGLVLHQLERKGAPFICGGIFGVMDMRTTQWAMGSPDTAFMIAAATDLIHSHQLPVYGTAGCTDALSVDHQAVAEATLLCVMAQLSGANLVHDIGMMAGAQLVSPEMIVLFEEVLGMVDHATRRMDTSPGELLADLVDQVGPGGNYVTLDHTLANFRRFWYSDVFLRDRLPDPGRDEDDAVRDRVNSKTRRIVESHYVEPLSTDVMRELDEMEAKWMSRIGAGVS